METIKQIKEAEKEIYLLNHTAGLLAWDQETGMPSKAGKERAAQIALMQKIIHGKITDKKWKTFFNDLPVEQELSFTNRALVNALKKRYQKATLLDSDFVKELAETESLSLAAWIEAKQKNDWQLFQPHLDKLLSLNREKAKRYSGKDNPDETTLYNQLLDDFEEGCTADFLDTIFDKLEKQLLDLIQSLPPSVKGESALLKQDFPIEGQKQAALEILKLMNFDLEGGRLDISAHPFTTTLGFNDVRLTTRYTETAFPSSLMSVIHEAGHGLYEQGFSPDLAYTLLADGTSLGIHESQSRMWENQIGRSLPFWKFFFPHLQRIFPKQLKSISVEDFYREINLVYPGLIRVDADELYYNLHIIMRYRLERKLIAGEIKTNHLPEIWNEYCLKYFDKKPETNSKGVLQDIHWSMGSFGYFPTYSLGNLYAAQFFAKWQEIEPDWQNLVERGELNPLKNWLGQNIHVFGKTKNASQLSMDICGKELDPIYFSRYLKDKFKHL